MSAGSLVRVRCVLPDGAVEWLDQELLAYDAPFDLAPQGVGGSRAVDSPLVAHTDDGWPTEYAYTLTGHLHATDPDALEVLYFRVKRLLRYADQVWRGQRFLKLRGGLLAGGETLPGQCVVLAPILCRVAELRWYDEEGASLDA